jgi:hypothetical protein
MLEFILPMSLTIGIGAVTMIAVTLLAIALGKIRV